MLLVKNNVADGVLKVELTGSLDVSGSSAIEGAMEEIAAENNKVVIDLSKVDFIASIGIRVLVKTAKAVSEKGGKLSVFGPTEEASRVLKTTGLDILLRVASDEAGAVAAVS